MDARMKNSDYTVGWICAISTEYVAARALLDEEHQDVEYDVPPRDSNTYTLGRFGKHMTVIAVLPDGEYGTSAATGVAKDLLNAFPNVRVGLMVGIGGGAPSQDHDVRLGDVVVSSTSNGKGGVVQYDFGKTIQDQVFHMTGFLNSAPSVLRTAVSTLKGRHEMDGHDIEKIIDVALKKKPRLRKKYSRPGSSSDRLYIPELVHGNGSCCVADYSGREKDLVPRVDRDEGDETVIHYGLIASGNQLMKDALTRDRLSTESNILCFEMEAAGLMNWFPCLVIRGICDYSDSHKNKEWQGFAAMTAAAYAKELLYQIKPKKVEAEERISKLEKVVTDIWAKQHKQEDRKVLEWLTRMDYGTRHSDVFRDHQPGTGQWLLESEEFQSWTSQNDKTLFCSGDPGAGKTVLSSVVVEHLLKNKPKTVGLALIYCNYREQASQTVEGLLSCLLRQLCEPLSPLPDQLTSLYENHKERHTLASALHLSEVLSSVVAAYSKTYIVIDALDECEKKHREKLLKELFELQTQKGINIFATSRKISDIESIFEGRVHKEIVATEADIRKYTHGRLEVLPDFIRRDSALQEEIIVAIAKAVSGMFLLARLYLDSIEGANSIKDIRTSIQNPSTGADAYDYAYDDAMQRIQGQVPNRASLATRVLQWIAFAARPLEEDELRAALSVEVDAPEFDQEGLVQVDMAATCAGLVTIDKKSRIIRLVHYTTQNYFERNMESFFPNAHNSIADVCITYLSFHTFSDGCASSESKYDRRLDKNPLYHYAAHAWGIHAAQVCNSSRTDERIISFLKDQKLVEASAQVLSYGLDYLNPLPRPRVTGLHMAAYFGLEAATELLCRGNNVNVLDDKQATPLSYAAKNGQENIVRFLTSEGAFLEAKDDKGQTPLCLAAANGHEGTVRFLAEKGASVDTQDKNKQSPLCWAAENGHEAIVRFLVEKDAFIESHDYLYGQTPLCWAARSGYEGIVRFLIEKGAAMEAEDRYGRTPLSWAARHGHKSTIQFLLGIGAAIETRDHFGWTPLSFVAQEGDEDMVAFLLDHGASIEAQDRLYGRTPLYWAARNRREAVGNLLIERGASVDIEQQEGEPFLDFAAGCGWDAVVQSLVARGARVKPSALFQAVKKGRRSTVDCLIELGVSIKGEDRKGRTPIFYAAKKGHTDIVRLLVEKGASIESRDHEGQTPLLYSLSKDSEAGAQCLINLGASLDVRDDGGRTYASWAMSKRIKR